MTPVRTLAATLVCQARDVSACTGAASAGALGLTPQHPWLSRGVLNPLRDRHDLLASNVFAQAQALAFGKTENRCARKGPPAGGAAPGPRPVITAWLYSRFGSRDLGEFSDEILAAMRSELGGHAEGRE